MKHKTLNQWKYWKLGFLITTAALGQGLALAQAPGNVTGNLALWLKADSEITTNVSNEVTIWGDQSGNSFDALATYNNTDNNFTTITQPTLLPNNFNFNPALDFESDTDALWSEDFSTALNDTFIEQFFAQKEIVTSGKVISFDRSSTGSDRTKIFDYGIFNSDFYQTRIDNNTAPKYSYGSGPSNGVIRSVYTGKATAAPPAAVDATVTAVNNGVSIAPSAPVFGNFTGTRRYAVGYTDIGAKDEGFVGKVSELITYNRVLTAVERSRVNSYLAIKYGVTLDQASGQNYVASDGTTLMWDASVNTTYNKDIFGIGRDNDSDLHQKVSRSQNADDVLIVATTNNFTLPNDDASRTDIASDLSFATFANNNGATSSVKTELPTDITAPQINARIAREWQVQLENFTQPVNFKFDGFASNASATYYLVKDSDGDFSTGSVRVGALNANGEIANITLADGEFITLMLVNDSDGDGVSNDVEVANGTSTTNACDPMQAPGYTSYDASNATWAAADCDGDGVTNGDEAINGTDPYSNTDSDGDGIP
ncbi:thrombospondin type 3 repeat-containing protein, partial [Ostreibacterium oceani]